MSMARRPFLVVILSFVLLIGAGTILLLLPAATRGEASMRFSDALFTATSAACVTGLVVEETGTYFSTFGHVVILVLIQLGGLGIMTLSAFVVLATLGRLGVRNKATLHGFLDIEGLGRVGTMIRFVVLFTFLFELAGAAAFYFLWRGDPEQGRPLFDAVFHAVSAFCNAGFSTFEGNLAGLRDDAASLAVFAVLIVCGGLGFAVVWNLRTCAMDRLKGRRTRLTLHSKFVLIGTAVLIPAGVLPFLLFEWSASLEGMSATGKWVCALFHGVTPRTAGFNTIDYGQVTPASVLGTMGLMLAGGAPGSTAGGLKITTIVILGFAASALIQGREENNVAALGRNLPVTIVRKAMAITFFMGLSVLTGTLLLLMIEQTPLDVTLFETISALCTVGLSMGLTPELSVSGKLVVSLLMFVGRIGPLTVILALSGKTRRVHLQYPEERVMVG